MDLYRNVFTIVFVLRMMNLVAPVGSVVENCSSFLNNYRHKISDASIPSAPVLDASLKYCSRNDQTCCTAAVEEKLKEIGKNDYEKIIRKTLQNLSRTLKSKSSKFNEYFKELLSKSKKDFHEMFKKTYGIVYEQNSYVFSDFFSELEKYFSYGKSNLADVMDTFFNILYQKMFTVMNSQFKFDDKYLGCVSEHMNELKPFGDVPQKLSLPLKRSFVAARIYAQSLNIVGDVVSNLINMVPSESCLKSILKMSHCSSCKGLTNVKICNNYCLNVMKGCLAFHTDVDIEWNAFVEALHKVQQRLLGPFNIELVVEPINVKISEAIMNFQESASQVSNKVFNGCGKPPLLDNKKRRRRRQANEYPKPSKFEEKNNPRLPTRFDRRRKEKEESTFNRSGSKDDKNKRKGVKDSYDSHPYKSSQIDGFLKFIQEIGDHILTTKYFWKRLPYYVCKEEINVETNGSAVCWTGNSMGVYEKPVVLDGLKNQQSNEEVLVDPKRQLASVSEQVFTLKSVSMQLKNAYNGQDVEWIDNEEMFDSSSGSGLFPDSDGLDNENRNNEGSGLFGPSFTSGMTSVDTSTINSDTYSISVFSNRNRFDASNNTSTPSTYFVTSVMTSNATNQFDRTNEVLKSSILVSTIPNVVDTDISASTVGITNVDDNNDNGTDTSGGTVSRYDKMSLNQAVATYLLPTVVIWVGGSFNDWFHSIANRT